MPKYRWRRPRPRCRCPAMVIVNSSIGSLTTCFLWIQPRFRPLSDSYRMQEKFVNFICHMPLPVWFFRTTGGFLYAFSWPKSPLQSLWRGLLEGLLELVSNFKEASKKFKIKYCNSKLFPNFWKTSAFWSLKKYPSLDTIPVKSFLFIFSTLIIWTNRIRDLVFPTVAW